MRVIELAITCAVALSCASCAPHMNIQQSVKPYKQTVPAMPAGIAPTCGRLETYTLQQSKLAKNPTADTPANRENGRIYYGYYCVQCHGADGRGDGPVGQSYVPKPTDLAFSKVAQMTDGQLYWKMLNGTGHSPVMVQTVQPEHRWPLVLYVKKGLAR
jgi:mono/diheme cytochrome c family protein